MSTIIILAYLIGIALLIYFVLWNVCLLGYQDKHTEPIEPDPDHCFCPEAKPIVMVHEPRQDKAILMIHGFPSTPRVYTYSAKRMFDAGYDVYVPLLPGFGTDPKVFEKTTFTQWYGYLEEYYLGLRKQYPHLIVLGTSMGGAMTLKIGERFSGTAEEPDALVEISAPVVYNSLLRDGVVTNWGTYIMRTAGLFTPSIGGGIKCGNPGGEDGNEDWTGYKGLFIRQGISLVAALKTIRKELPRLTCPLFSIHDKNDKTVPFKNQAIIERETKSGDWKKLVTCMGPYQHSHHCLLMYHSIQEELTDTIIAYMDEKTK